MLKNNFGSFNVELWTFEEGYGMGGRAMINPKACNALANVSEFGWGGAAGASVYVDTSIKWQTDDKIFDKEVPDIWIKF